MKKIVDFKGKCDAYQKDTKDFHGEVNACCATCYYLLFAHCFVKEAKANDKLVCSALEGWNEDAKKRILRKIESCGENPK